LDRKLLLPPDVLAAIDATPFDEPIFNGEASGATRRRLQGRSFEWAPALEALFTARLRAAGLLACSDGSLKTVNDCFALRSLPQWEPRRVDGKLRAGDAKGASESERGAGGGYTEGEEEEAAALAGRQPAHSDAPPPEGGGGDGAWMSDLADKDVPLSVLLAIQKNTRLWVWPAGCPRGSLGGDDGAQLVRLNVGQLLVWRGDLVHAGAGYARQHTRVHAYCDPPAHLYRRPRARTNLCGGARQAEA
jgi:hypothetical protein